MSGEPLKAQTANRTAIPILDITHSAFSQSFTEADLPAMEQRYIEESSRTAEIPEAILHALRTSTLGSALIASAGTYLAGLPTYLLKLGPENLGTAASAIDRRIAASFPALCARLRLEDISRLTASALIQAAAAQPQRPICILNIGGGTAADSWNTLILARRDSPGLLKDGSITVAIIDPDLEGPAFAVNALGRLAEPSAPLNGLLIGVRHLPIGWSQLDSLSDALHHLHAQDAICAISSEGALFEYGSDEEIVSVLQSLHSATTDAFITGSVTREGPCAEAAQRTSRTATRPRTLEAFSLLAASSGWRLDHAITRPFSFQVRLTRA